MRNFNSFIRHYQLINWKIVVYSIKEIGCLLKGESGKPSLTTEKISEYMSKLEKGNVVESLPMGSYEYDCCVEYLKKIRHELLANRKNFATLTLTFGKTRNYPFAVAPLEDCLEMVTKEVGFKVVDEKFGNNQYEYTLKSVL